LHAAFAADAAAIVEIHDAVVALEERGHRTNFDAGCICAMVAAHDGEKPARVRELTLLNVLHPGAVDAEGDVVLGFASDGAGMATDAFAIVDDEAKVHSFLAANLKLTAKVPP
jgi:hypothetical protein